MTGERQAPMTEQFEMLGPLADDLYARLDAMSTDELNRLIRESEMVTSANAWFALFYLAPAAAKVARIILERQERKTE